MLTAESAASRGGEKPHDQSMGGHNSDEENQKGFPYFGLSIVY